MNMREFHGLICKFDSSVTELEQKIGKIFKLIFFQFQSDRVGHLWHEPSVVCSIYKVSPNELLIISCTRPYSEFCIVQHQKVGITYASVNQIDCAEFLLPYFQENSMKEISLRGRSMLVSNVPLWEQVNNRKVGWNNECLESLLSCQDFENMYEEVLSRYGLDYKSKIVVLHVRDSGWTGIYRYHDYRNADIYSYRVSCDYLASQGYTIVRIGDRSMPQLNIHSKGVIDLPFREEFKDGDDVLFISMCDFYIGQTSGPYSIAVLLEKDILLLNEPNPIAGRFPQKMGKTNQPPLTLILYKWRHNIKENRRLDLLEFLFSPYVTASKGLEDEDLILIDNSDEEILEATIEFLSMRQKPSTIENQGILYRRAFMEYAWFLRGFRNRQAPNIGRPTAGAVVSKIYSSDIEKYFPNPWHLIG